MRIEPKTVKNSNESAAFLSLTREEYNRSMPVPGFAGAPVGTYR